MESLADGGDTLAAPVFETALEDAKGCRPTSKQLKTGYPAFAFKRHLDCIIPIGGLCMREMPIVVMMRSIRGALSSIDIGAIHGRVGSFIMQFCWSHVH